MNHSPKFESKILKLTINENSKESCVTNNSKVFFGYIRYIMLKLDKLYFINITNSALSKTQLRNERASLA